MGSRSQDVTTPRARLAFAQGLHKLQKNAQGRESWNCTLLFPKTIDMTALHNAALEAATEEWGDKASDRIQKGLIHTPFLDGDGKQGMNKKTGEPHAGFPGHTFLRVQAGADWRPRMFDRKRQPIDDAKLLYSGCFVHAVVNAFTWTSTEKGDGISFGISMIQFAQDGESLGGGAPTDPTQFFNTIEDEGDAPGETRGGGGASSLFGAGGGDDALI